MSKLDWKHTRQFFMSALWTDFAGGMVVVALPYFAMRLGAESLGLGVLGAARGLAYMVGCIPAALFADRLNRRTVIYVSCALSAASLLLMPSASRLWHVVAISVIWSATVALFWPALFGWLGDSHRREQLGRATGAVNVAWSLGAMAGGALAGWLYEVRPALPFIAAAAPTLLACAVLARGTPGSQPAPLSADTGRIDRNTWIRLSAAWVGNVSTCCMFGLLTGVFPDLGEKEIHITPAVFGVLVAILGAGRTLIYASALWRHAHLQDWRLAVVGQMVAAGMLATVSFASAHGWLALVFAVVGLSVGVAYYLALYRSLEGEGSRGLKCGIHEATLLGGVLIGTLGGGYIADRWGLRAPYVPTACFAVVLVAVQVVLNLSAGQPGARPQEAESISPPPGPP